MPIMERMCETCPYHEAGWKHVRQFLKDRARTEASPICHSTGSGALTKKKHKQSHLCRGARNYMLERLHSSGFLEAATDAAWDKKCAEMGIKPDTCK